MLKKSNKKKAVKFILAPRPQKDPLAADIDAPQHVLVPKDGSNIDEVRKKLPDFDPELFASSKETKTGMLERAHNADGITFDSDILRAMSKDFDFEDPNNVLDDDFLDQAGGLIEDEGEMVDGEMTDLTLDLFKTEPQIITFARDQHSSCNQDDDECEDSDADQILEGEEEAEADEDDRRTVFTNYSMTSSVMRRSQGLQHLDEHFERLYEKEYADDTEIGALDLNEVKGGEELLSNIEQIKEMKREIKIVRKKNHGDDYEPELVSEHHKVAVIGDEPNAEDEDLVDVEVKVRENRVDCESILSYNSNIYNHPKLISEPRKRSISKDTSSVDVEMNISDDSKKRTRSALVAQLSSRPQNESQEEKRARKRAVKAYRRERREERKTNQKMFKAEKMRLIDQQRNNAPALKLA